jgi:hypothetical protein
MGPKELICSFASTEQRSCQSHSYSRSFLCFMDPEVSMLCSEEPTPALSPEIGNQGPILTASFGYFHQDIDLPSGIFHTVFLTNIF